MGERGGPTGLVLNIQRLSTEDGPGIRSTVFLKQCPLACRWCHNPESISGRPELQWLSQRCIGCRSCVPACPHGFISFGSGGVRIERARCDGCGACAEECPSNALQLLGRSMAADSLVAALCRDRAYYDSSGGGVTLSGGEPLAQPTFASAVLRGLKAQGIATAVDTCGFASAESLDLVLPHADLVLYDLKMIDPAAHRAFTGQGNEIILRNLLRVAGKRAEGRRVDGDQGPRLWIRTPLIPGATATAENLRAIGSYIALNLDGAVDRWELCAFNNLCRDQYNRLGIPWDYAGTTLLGRDELGALRAHAQSSGVDPRIVAVTGAARADDVSEKGDTVSETAGLTTFSASDIEGLAPAMKIGLLATVNGEGLPHVTLLSSLRADSPTTLTFGQFTEGLSKENIRRNPHAGFLVMSLQKKIWRGRASFTGTEKCGRAFDAYNNEPLFRYNSYFGIHTVYNLDLVAQTGSHDLPMGRIIAASLATALARAFAGSRRGCAALNPWTHALMSAMGALKFAAWVAPDGYPRIIPILQAQAASRDRILFSSLVYGEELAEIPQGAGIALFGMTLSMEDVLMRGKYTGMRRIGGIKCGVAQVDWLYNSMPPVAGQVYPPLEIPTIRTFDVPA